MNRKQIRQQKKNRDGYRKLSDYPQLSDSARHRLFYTKRTINSPKEARILKWAKKTASYRFQFVYYIGGVVAFMSWAATGQKIITLLGCVGLCYVFYRYIRMTWSYEERITYEREYPVKTITDVHRELVRDGLITTGYAFALTFLMFALMLALSGSI